MTRLAKLVFNIAHLGTAVAAVVCALVALNVPKAAADGAWWGVVAFGIAFAVLAWVRVGVRRTLDEDRFIVTVHDTKEAAMSRLRIGSKATPTERQEAGAIVRACNMALDAAENAHGR